MGKVIAGLGFLSLIAVLIGVVVSARGTPSTIFSADPDTGGLSFIREAPCPKNVISGFSTSTPGK